MATSSINRGIRVPQYPVQRHYGQNLPDGLEVKDGYYQHKGGGLDFASRLFYVPKEKTPYQRNWRLDRGTMLQRSGTSIMGPGVNSEVIGLMEFKSSAGTTYQIRWTQAKVSIYNAGSNTWTDATGPAFAVSAGSHVYATSWADTVVFQIDTEHLYVLTPAGPTYVQINTLAGSGGGSAGYTNGKQITTFAGRVIVSQADQPYRIAWCVKNNNTDWTGIGSGFEDLFSAPGGNADTVLGVYPVSDDQAIVVRTRTIWLMVTTGIVDVPFRFSRLYANVACESPWAIQTVPGGVIVPTLDAIYYVAPGEIQSIGDDIRPRYISLMFNPGLMSATFDEPRGEYVLGVLEGSSTFINAVYRYSFADKGWSRDEYPFGIKLLAYSRYVGAGLTIAQLTGTIPGLIGPIGSLGSTGANNGVMLCGKAVGGASAGFGFVLRENPMTMKDWDATFLTNVDSPTEIWTGIVQDGPTDSLLTRDMVTDVQMEYLMTNGAVQVAVDWSPDGGISWVPYSPGNMTLTTNVPDSLRFAGTIEAEQPLFRFRTGVLAGLRYNGSHFFITEGAKAQP